MTDTNPLAPIEALAPHVLINDCGMSVEWISPLELRDALTEARQALGEVTVTEEWACVVDDCDACGPPRRRTVVTTRRVGEWEW